MNLLIFTQKVDLNDSELSFFHSWIIEFAKRFEKIIVICLFEGKHSLPNNVKVISLGKDKMISNESTLTKRLVYVSKFYSNIIRLRDEYDAVFVHQNQEYAFLGGKIWWLLGKKLYMWRNHFAGSKLTDLAALFCAKVFCTSKFSYTAKYGKTVFMPVGVDTDVFRPQADISRSPMSILSIGRISAPKKIDQLINAVKDIPAAQLSVYGNAIPRDQSYFDELKKLVSDNTLSGRVKFIRGVPNSETPKIYSTHNVFVNLSPSGMFDKTIFEAMACETISVNCNKNLVEKIDERVVFEEDNVAQLRDKLKLLMNLSATDRDRLGKDLRKFAEQNHSLKSLGDRLYKEIHG